MWLSVAVLLSLEFATALGQDANAPRCQEVPVCSRDECRQCDLSEYELSLSETDVVGRFRAQLLARRCRVERLQLMFYRYNINNSVCDNLVGSEHLDDRLIHSEQTFSCDDDGDHSENTFRIISSDDIRNETYPRINLTYYIDMVYDGCYMLEYFITYNKSYSYRAWQITWVHEQNNTEYNITKDEFEDRLNDSKILANVISPNNPLTLKLQYKLPSNEFEIYIWNTTMQVTLQDRNNKDLCTVSYINIGSEVRCYMPKHISPGNYTLGFSLYTSYCKGTIFNKVLCKLENNFQILDAQLDTGNRIPESSSVDLLTIVSVILCLFTILGMVAVTYCHYTKRNILPEHQKDLLRQLKSPTVRREELRGIVLVYARDCEPFMQAMVEFRRLLELRCGVKVYDIFDVHLFNTEISKAPQDWARGKLLTPGVKFILVKTRCGELLYDPIVVGVDDGLHLEGPLLMSTGYRTPRYTDSLVQTLFRLVRDDALLPGSYLKYFVVQISHFSGDRQFFHVNPYRRYALPSTVNVLVSHITNQPQASYEYGEPEQNLELAIHKLTEYVTQNEDYIVDLVD